MFRAFYYTMYQFDGRSRDAKKNGTDVAYLIRETGGKKYLGSHSATGYDILSGIYRRLCPGAGIEFG